MVTVRRYELEERYGIQATGEAGRDLEGAKSVLLDPKPQDFASFADRPKPEALIVSIMAGVSIATIRDQLGSDCIVRVMPNTPAAIQQGMSVWTATDATRPEHREFAKHLLSSIGQ